MNGGAYARCARYEYSFSAVQKHLEPSRWRRQSFASCIQAALEAILNIAPPPRTPQSRLTHIISCSPAALAVTRTLSASRARRALPPDSACVLVPQIDTLRRRRASNVHINVPTSGFIKARCASRLRVARALHVHSIPRPPRRCPAPPCISIAKASNAAHSTSSTLLVVCACSAALGADPLLRPRRCECASRSFKPPAQAVCSSHSLNLKPPALDARSRRSRNLISPLVLGTPLDHAALAAARSFKPLSLSARARDAALDQPQGSRPRDRRSARAAICSGLIAWTPNARRL